MLLLVNARMSNNTVETVTSPGTAETAGVGYSVVRVARERGAQRRVPRKQSPATGTWNVTSLWSKEPELVRDAHRYQLDIVSLTSKHSLALPAVNGGVL